MTKPQIQKTIDGREDVVVTCEACGKETIYEQQLNEPLAHIVAFAESNNRINGHWACDNSSCRMEFYDEDDFNER